MLAVALWAGASACGAEDDDRIPPAAALTIDTATTLPGVSTTAGVAGDAPAIGSVAGPGGSGAGDDGTLHGVGEAVATANGNTVRLLGVDGAGAGVARYATEVEVCTARAARVAPSQFTLEIGNGSAVPAVGDGKPPALAVADIPAGQCRAGWVTFQLPPDQPAIALVFRGSSVIRWSLA